MMKKKRAKLRHPRVYYRWYRMNCLRHTLWLCVIGGTIWLLWKCISLWGYSEAESAAQRGDLVGGFAGAVAFLWLVYSIFLQRQELALQRLELRAQREQLEIANRESANQSESMRKQGEAMNAQLNQMIQMGKYAAREALSKEISEAVATFGVNGFPELKNFISGTRYMKIAQHYTFQSEASSALSHFKERRKSFENCLTRIAKAMTRYRKDIGQPIETEEANYQDFFLAYGIHIMNELPETAIYRDDFLGCIDALMDGNKGKDFIDAMEEKILHLAVY